MRLRGTTSRPWPENSTPSNRRSYEKHASMAWGVRIDFHAGPNGSGKSNVIDAMLFAFGKRAKKPTNVSELIHRSEQYPNLESARVSVHLPTCSTRCRPGRVYHRRGPELVVSRTAFSSNQSSMTSMAAATFKEVGALLQEGYRSGQQPLPHPPGRGRQTP